MDTYDNGYGFIILSGMKNIFFLIIFLYIFIWCIKKYQYDIFFKIIYF